MGIGVQATIIRDLRIKIEALHKTGTHRPMRSRKKRLDFYNSAVDQCGYFHGIRDDVSHTRGYYDAGQALSVLTHVEEFMRLLAQNGVKLPPPD
jgi:hypothetical protein